MAQDTGATPVPDNDDDRKPDALAVKIDEWITETYDHPINRRWRDRIQKSRQYNSGRKLGEEGGGDIEGLVRANLIYSTIQTILPRVYAKNPEIAISPSETVDEKRLDWVKPFCKTLSIVLRRQFTDAKLKRRGKSSARSAMVCGLAWLKLSYQRDIRKDAEIFNRISDTQDNLQRVEKLLRDMDGDGDHSPEQLEAEKRELEIQIEGLQKEAEVVVAEGLVIDRIKPEDMIVDLDIDDPDAYTMAKRMAFRVWHDRDAYETKFGEAPAGKATLYTGDDVKHGVGESGKSRGTAGGKSKHHWAVWEIWDRTAQAVYTKAEGDDQFCKPPIIPERIGERFYPFFLLMFNPLDGEFYPLSDVEMLQEIADEYNATRTQLAEHREQAVPHWIANADTDVKTLRRYVDKELGEIVLVDAPPGTPIDSVIRVGQVPPINPALYDTSPIRTDFELISGAGDAARGSVHNPKTLGEAEILNEALASRTNERQDTIEDLITDMAVFATEILLFELPPEKVEKLAGPAAVWPQMDREQIFDLVQIETRSGTSGKPNKIQDQRQWMEFLPLVRDTAMQVAQLREQGRDELADTLIATLKETFRRFDERLDVEEFIAEPEEGSPEEQVMQLRGQLAEMQQALEQTQQQAIEVQQQAAQQIDQAQRSGQQLLDRKLWELEKMKLEQMDAFSDMVQQLQARFQDGVGEMVKTMLERVGEAMPQAPPAAPTSAPAAPIHLQVIMPDGSSTGKTIEVAESDADGNWRRLEVMPMKGPETPQ